MHSTTSPSPRLLGAVAATGGLAWVTVGALQAARADGVRDDVVETAAAHIALGAMATALVLTVAGLLLLARSVPTSRGPLAAAVGQVVLAAAATGANVNGSDPSWFVVAAPLGNALWLFGSIATARALHRAGAARSLVVGLPLVWACAIPLSLLGCGVLAGAFWIAVGLGAAVHPARPVPVTA